MVLVRKMQVGVVLTSSVVYDVMLLQRLELLVLVPVERHLVHESWFLDTLALTCWSADPVHLNLLLALHRWSAVLLMGPGCTVRTLRCTSEQHRQQQQLCVQHSFSSPQQVASALQPFALPVFVLHEHCALSLCLSAFSYPLACQWTGLAQAHQYSHHHLWLAHRSGQTSERSLPLRQQ